MISSFEIRRKVFHVCLGLILSCGLYFGYFNWILIGVVTLLGGGVVLLTLHTRLPFISWFLENFERPQYIKSFPGRGIFFFFLSATLVSLLFSLDIAVASILILTFGDSAAHLVGAGLGRRRNPLSIGPVRMFEGLIAGIVCGMFAALLVVPFWLAFFGSLCALIVESIAIRIGGVQIDDNLLIPLIAGAVMSWMAFALF